MASTGMNNLTTLIKRLEAATSRLEDIASSALPQEERRQQLPTSISNVDQPASQNRAHSDDIPTPASVRSVQAAVISGEDTLPASIEAFRAIVREELESFESSSKKIGSHVARQGIAFCDVFRAQERVILVANKAKKPQSESSAYRELLKPLFDGVAAVNEVKEQNRKDPQENHLSMLEGGGQIIGWVQWESSPDSFIDDTLASAQFYGNKVLREFREKDQTQVDWVKAFVKLIGSLKSYIKQHHPRGLSWNSSGVEIEDALKAISSVPPQTNGIVSASAASPGAPVPPPPPPPPPLPVFDSADAKPTTTSSAHSDMGAVFEQLNRGEAVTTGLRKVDKSQMTHKNPSLRAQSSKPTRSDSNSSRGKSPNPPVKQKPESMRSKRPPRKELDGNKWTLENFENESSPVDIPAERRHSILVSRCKSVTIRVTGKANAVSIDNCNRVDIIVESLVSSMDVINSNSFRMQVTGTMPAIQLDKVDGATLYLSKESLGTEIYTSKCTSINVTLPPASEKDDSLECPVPEQFKSVVVDGKLISEIVKQDG